VQNALTAAARPGLPTVAAVTALQAMPASAAHAVGDLADLGDERPRACVPAPARRGRAHDAAR